MKTAERRRGMTPLMARGKAQRQALAAEVLRGSVDHE